MSLNSILLYQFVHILLLSRLDSYAVLLQSCDWANHFAPCITIWAAFRNNKSHLIDFSKELIELAPARRGILAGWAKPCHDFVTARERRPACYAVHRNPEWKYGPMWDMPSLPHQVKLNAMYEYLQVRQRTGIPHAHTHPHTDTRKWINP